MMWDSWKRHSKHPYWYAYIPEHPNATKKGYVLEHRIVMENKLGRLLRSGEVVHHKNGNKKDNIEDNLVMLFTHQHNRMEADEKKKRYRIEFVCAYCGKTFSRKGNQVRYAQKKGQTEFCCSNKCRGKLHH